jgi:hypothetical protein
VAVGLQHEVAMKLLVVAAVACAGCAHAHHDSGGAAIMTGALVSPDTRNETGAELRIFGGFATDDPAVPNAYGFAVREVGGDVQTIGQWGWAGATRVGSAAVFGRLMFDVISRNTIAHETTLSAFSPTADIGVAPFGHGICVSASATWDVHFDAPDRLLLGAFVGMCGGKL